MTFRIDKIEIQQQPERQRYWAEVEVLTPSGFRRKRIETPDTEGHWGLLNAIGAYCDEYVPAAERYSPARRGYWVPGNNMGDPDQWMGNSVSTTRPTMAEIKLRAEAEAAGVRVDKRWGEGRLRQEIASARPAVATLGDARPGDGRD